MKPLPTARIRSLLIVGSSLLATSISQAADITWDITPGTIGSGDSAVTGGAGIWDTTNGNWTTDAGVNNIAWVNANNDTAVFGGTAGTVTLGEAITVGGLTLNTANYLITGNTLTLASGTTIHSTVGTSNSNDPVITSVLAGTNGFTKTGGGWLGLEGTTSSLSGNINIAAGTLYARFSALGSGNLVFTGNSNFTKVYGSPNAATTGFTINDGVTASIGGSTFYYNFATDGALVGNSSAKLVIQTGGNTQKDFNSTSNTFTGELTLEGGGTADNGQRTGFKSLADSNQKIIINDALFRLNNGGVSMNFANRQLEMTSNARLDNDSTNSAVTMSFAKDLSVKTGNNERILYLTGANTGNNTFSGVIGNSSTGTGATQVRKQEGGTWILGANNSYTGKTTVDNGALVVSSLKDIGTDSSVGKGGTLQLGYYTTAGTLRYVGGGDSTDRPIQINDYTNGTGNTGAGIILNNGSGALTFTATEFIPKNETVVANRSLELGGSYADAANKIQGIIQDIAPIAGKGIISVVKRNDASTWILSGDNSYKGTTTVSGGTLEIGGSGRLGSGNYAANISIASTNSGTLKFNSGSTQALGGVISGAGALVKDNNDGVLTLTNTNTYTGATTVNGGTLLINGSTSSTSLVTVASGATIGGTGTVGGAMTISGILAPGNSIGTLTANGSVTWNANEAWVFELGLGADTLALANTTSGLSDLLNINGGFQKGTGSSFTFDFAGGGTAGWYKLVDWTGSTGFLFSDFVASNLDTGLTGSFTVDSGTSALYLNVVPEPRATLLGGLGLLMVIRRRR